MSARAGRWWRTVRHLRPAQIGSQLRRRLLRPAVTPLAWRGPPPALRVRAPIAPFLGAPAHARYEAPEPGAPGASQRIQLLDRSVRFAGAIDWDWQREGPLWAYHLHQFDYLRRTGLAPQARAALVADWIARHERGVGWSPHPTSLRVQSWIKLLLTPGALALDTRAEQRLRSSLGSQLATLAENLETHLGANHLLSNLLAVVLGGLVFAGPEADGWLALEAALRRELSQQVLPDGSHVERSPMYHALLLESVLDLANVAEGSQGRAPPPLEQALRDAAARMLGALAVWRLPDGQIALFGDSAFGIAQEPLALEAYGDALGIAPKGPPRPGLLDASGFVQLAAGPFALIASLAGPMPAHQPGHAHADALSFELAVGGVRVVTDTGVSEYRPGALRDASRATRAHATIEVAGRDQAELWAAHRIGGRPRVRLESVEPGRAAEGSCAGWATPDTLHRRTFRVEAQRVEVHDAIEGRERPVRLCLPLAPGLEPRLEGANARLQLPGGAELRIALPGGAAWRVERAPYFPEFGSHLERAALVGEAERFRSGTWIFRLAAR